MPVGKQLANDPLMKSEKAVNNICDRLVGLLARVFGVETEKTSLKDTFSELEMDSLTMVELGLAAQEEFGVDIDEKDIRSDHSIAEAAGVIAAKLASTE